jgi:hypothetical protein
VVRLRPPDVTDALDVQVRPAVELLVDAIGRADTDIDAVGACVKWSMGSAYETREVVKAKGTRDGSPPRA